MPVVQEAAWVLGKVGRSPDFQIDCDVCRPLLSPQGVGAGRPVRGRLAERPEPVVALEVPQAVQCASVAVPTSRGPWPR